MYIGSATFFDIDKIADTKTDLPHMLPTQEEFINHMRNLRIKRDETIICFDHMGVFSAPRVWYTFHHVFSTPNVRVLNGGLAAWKLHKFPMTPGNILPLVPDKSKTADYNYVKQNDKVVSMAQVNEIFPKIISREIKHAICDARAGERFRAEVDEPRDGLRRGCIPGSINIPFKELLNKDGITMKSVQDLKEYFAAKKVDLDSPITASCGSGLTACVILLAAHRAGAKKLSLYDGSWSEYVFLIKI